MELRAKFDADRPTGLLLVGALGMTGMAVLGGVSAMKKGVIPEQYGTTGHPAFASTDLISTRALRLGGWDYSSCSFSQRAREYGHLPPEVASSIEDDQITSFPGLWTTFEYPLTPDQSNVYLPQSVAEGAKLISENIKMFRSAQGCEEVIVIFVGTPARELAPQAFDISFSQAVNSLLPSGVMYALGAIDAGAHFVDFTPSRTLEFTDLWRLAEEAGVQLAGRDGSTGQTMLKVTVAEMLARRGISVDAWYSTNLIGNRDGLVLSHADYAGPKLADKTDALHASDPCFHRVNIEYCPPWGDRKEAWDAVECRTWLGAPLSIRVNWRGHDSQLAGALIVDLIRLIELGSRRGFKGFQSELGFFFKRPFTRENTTISDRWRELVETYVSK